MRLAFILILIFSILDFAATQFLIQHYGMIVEINPILLNLMKHTDTVWIILYNKLTFIIILGLVLFFIHKRKIILKDIFKRGIWITTFAQAIIALYGVSLVIHLNI